MSYSKDPTMTTYLSYDRHWLIVNCKIGTIAPGSLTPAFFLVLTIDIFAMTDLMGKANLEEWLANNPDKQPCELLGTPFFDNKIYPITVLREI